MNTETILTEAEIFDCFDKSNGTVCIDYYPDELFEMGRAIEQAVLQSPEAQAWKRDAERLRVVLKEAAAELDCLGSEIERIHRENPSIVATLPASNVLSMVRDAAMGQQK